MTCSSRGGFRIWGYQGITIRLGYIVLGEADSKRYYMLWEYLLRSLLLMEKLSKL
jgi:hypothetical protein